MTHEELVKSLDNALRSDTSGKTTPIQRLTPFLRDLVEFIKPEVFLQHQTVEGHLENGVFVADKVYGGEKVPSKD